MDKLIQTCLNWGQYLSLFWFEQGICRLFMCYFVSSVCLWMSAGVSGAEGLLGPHADAGSSGAGQCHWPPGAPFPPAGQLSAVPGAPGGAVPQAHVPLLKPCVPSLQPPRREKHLVFPGAVRTEMAVMRNELYKAVLFYLRTSHWCLIRAEVSLTEMPLGFMFCSKRVIVTHIESVAAETWNKPHSAISSMLVFEYWIFYNAFI